MIQNKFFQPNTLRKRVWFFRPNKMKRQAASLVKKKSFACETLAPSAVGIADNIPYARVRFLPGGLLSNKKFPEFLIR
jgi:hypothetical protein